MKGKAKYGMYEKKVDVRRNKAGQRGEKRRKGWKGDRPERRKEKKG